MRPLSRILLSASSLAALLAPALMAETAGTLRSRPDATNARSGRTPGNLHDANTSSGFGAGMWIAPTDLMGFASAQLYDAAGNVRYTMRANLLPAQAVPRGMDLQGGFLGILFRVEANGERVLVADVSGKWIQTGAETAEFDVDVMARTGDDLRPFEVIGRIQGALLPANVIPAAGGPGIEPVDDLDEPDGPSSPGHLALSWVILDG